MTRNYLNRAVGIAAMCLVAACSSSSSTGPPPPPPPPPPPAPPPMNVSFAAEVQPIYSVSCVAGCHTGGTPDQGLNLEAGMAYAQTVNIAATQLGTMDRIEPGDPDNSCLLHKLLGTQTTVGGGSRSSECGWRRVHRTTTDPLKAGSRARAITEAASRAQALRWFRVRWPCRRPWWATGCGRSRRCYGCPCTVDPYKTADSRGVAVRPEMALW